MALNALDRHLALIGFMGAGKSSLGEEAARLLARPFVDVDREIEQRTGASVPDLFATRGEAGFREVEAEVIGELLGAAQPAVLALGGGAVGPDRTRSLLREARVVLVEVDVDTAWARASGTSRPLAQDEGEFRRLYEERQPLYREVADAVATDLDGVILAAGGVHHEAGALDRLGELVPGGGPVALVADAVVIGIYGMRAQEALGKRLETMHELPPGEDAKQIGVAARLWSGLWLDRGGTVVALGGGCTTDLAGFVAATYLRGVPWVAVPTTLVGQVDAAIGGKTGIDIPEGKNLVGAFHWPARVVLDETLLETLPEREWRQGRAELVKTQLLAGHRAWLNLGHTFAHALEAAADYELPHGEAVALGLLAALRLSGYDTTKVERELSPQPVKVDLERAWQALQRDKKRTGGAINVVLLTDAGPVVEERPADEVRRELEQLIAQRD